MSLLSVHRALLERWRRSMNLVGPGSIDEHYDDCERALRWLDPTGRWVDLGSGAGFPGVVLAGMFPALSVDLVDSRRKRCAFLERVLTESGEPIDGRIRVRCGRIETLESGCYDGLCARALASPEAVLDHAARLLVPGGLAVLFLADAQPPDDPRFECIHVEAYAVRGRPRQAAGMRLR